MAEGQIWSNGGYLILWKQRFSFQQKNESNQIQIESKKGTHFKGGYEQVCSVHVMIPQAKTIKHICR